MARFHVVDMYISWKFFKPEAVGKKNIFTISTTSLFDLCFRRGFAERNISCKCKSEQIPVIHTKGN